MKRFILFLLAAVLGGVISVGAYKYMEGNNRSPFENSIARPASYTIKNIEVPNFDFAAVAEVVTPTVVHIKTTTGTANRQQQRGYDPFRDFFGEDFGFPAPRGPQMGSGSGVVISTDGFIVTNNHVIRGADKIEVVLNDKRSYTADVVGTDPQTDIALIKIQATDLQPVPWGNSDAIRVGEWVLAVGNPFNLTSTITAGIVSAKGRNINLLGGSSIESFIQTDAAVNPGNSGGALVDARGQLVGINTAIATQTGQYSGYSFAVPVNLVKKVIDDFREYGEVQRGFLGITIRDVDAALAREKNLPRPAGVFVDGFAEKSAAEAAGIKKGDVIVKVNDRTVNSVPELQELVGRARPGDEVKLNVLRGSSEKEIIVQLRNKDGKIGTSISATREMQKVLGVEFEQVPEDARKKHNLSNGVKISSVSKGVFQKAGVPQGFIVTRIDKANVYSSSDVYRLLQDKKEGVLIEGITPGGERKYYVLEMGE